MRLTALLTLLATAAIAGPVGRYLGFAVHRQGDAIGAGRDSFHVLIPSPFDSVVASSSVDTTTIIAETVRLGDSAWVLKQVTNATSELESERRNDQVEGPKSNFAISAFSFRLRPGVSPISASGPDAGATDTSYESGDTMLCSRQILGDSVCWLNAYRVPFSVGTAWLFGLAGTYIGYFAGDSAADTLTIWADTCTVLDTEDVVVPYGAVPHCYKIRRTMYQRLAAVESGVPVIESSYVRTFEWYKDSLWSIKESTQASGPVYTKIGIWLHTANFVSTAVTQLTGLGYVGIAAQPHAVSPAPLTVFPDPFRGSVLINCSLLNPNSSVHVFNSAGRLVRVLSPPQSSTPGPYSLSWDGRDDRGRCLPAGTYFTRAGNKVCPVTKVR